MAYGFIAYNDNSQIQISENNTNYVSIHSGSVASNSVAGQPDSISVNIPNYAQQEGDLLIVRYDISGLYGISGGPSAPYSSIRMLSWVPSPGIIEWKILRRFDTVTLSTTSEYGLEVYKPDGTSLCFSTRGEVGVIQSVFQTSASTVAGLQWNNIQPWMACNVSTGAFYYLPGEEPEPTETEIACVFSSKETATSGVYGAIFEIHSSGGFPSFYQPPNVGSNPILTRLAISTGN